MSEATTLLLDYVDPTTSELMDAAYTTAYSKLKRIFNERNKNSQTVSADQDHELQNAAQHLVNFTEGLSHEHDGTPAQWLAEQETNLRDMIVARFMKSQNKDIQNAELVDVAFAVESLAVSLGIMNQLSVARTDIAQKKKNMTHGF